MAPRKRGAAEMEAAAAVPVPAVPSLLTRLRNMWELANLMQFIYLFGDICKIDKDLDIDVSLRNASVHQPRAGPLTYRAHRIWKRNA